MGYGVMNICQFNHVIYKGNVNRDFYFYCLKNNFKLLKYLFINFFYLLISILFNSKKNIYIIKKFKYLKNVKNLDEQITLFYQTRNRYNNCFEFETDTIVDKVPTILMVSDKKNKVIGYSLNKDYEVELDKFNEKILNFENVNKKFVRNRFELNEIYADKIYLVHNNQMKQIRDVKINKNILNFFIIIFITIILTCISFCFTNSYMDINTNIDMYLSYFEIKLFLLNFLPLLLINLILFYAIRKLHLSFSITSFIILALGIANQTKLLYRDDIVKFEDVLLLKEAFIMTERYDIVIKKYTILAIILVLILFFVLKRYVPKLKCNRKKQVTIIILLLSISILFYKVLYKNDELYDKVGDQSLINVWIDTRQYQIRGLIYPFIYTLEDGFYVEPDGYNEEEVTKIIESYQYENIPEDKKVNIIAIMLEAYNDFSVFNAIDFNEDIYGKFHEIQKNSISGNLVTTIFGGGTIVTERNFLTGYYDMPNFRKKTNSYVWYFKEQGYVTEAMHPIYGAFYNRNTVNINLGFDNYYNYENKFSKVSSSFLEDYDFFDYIIEGYENAKEIGKPYFNFSVTYQNHGPYYSGEYEGKEYFFENLGYDTEAYNIINEYFTGIKKTNIALEKLVDYFDNEEEPVIIILFGDHNPFLGDNALAYNELGINLDLSTIDGFLNYYETPYIIHANNSAKEVFNKSFVGTGDTISPMFLMNELFDYCELSGNEYLQYMENMRGTIDVISDYYYKVDNNFINKNNVSKEIKDKIEEYKFVNYYYSKNFNRN